MTIDFRMTSSTLFSDVVLPAATWYEKHDINTTDMHPFVHSFNPAISPPWQSKTDWEAWKAIAKKFSELAVDHLGTRRDVVAKPLWHDTPEAMATVHGVVKDWRKGECEPVPGKTLPVLAVVERDFTQVYDKMTSIGPLLESVGMLTKGVPYAVNREVEILRRRNGVAHHGAGAGQPRLETDIHVADAILHLSGTTNGHLATHGFRNVEKRTGTALADLSAEHEGKQITFADTQVAPVPVITSPEWSGSESGGRRYAPFTINIERLKPFHTLTGRQQFYLDHDWILGMGEALPVYRPPLNMTELFGETALGEQNALGVSVRYLTPHNKWSIHSEYQDNLFMLSLSRGGQTIWMSDLDAEKIGVQGQRLDRGGQPQRRRRRPRDRLAPDAGGHRLHAPRPGPADRRAPHRDQRQAWRHPQLAHPDHDETEPHDRRLRAARLLLQLHRADRQQPRRGHDDPQAHREGRVLMSPHEVLRSCVAPILRGDPDGVLVLGVS